MPAEATKATADAKEAVADDVAVVGAVVKRLHPQRPCLLPEAQMYNLRSTTRTSPTPRSRTKTGA